MCGWHWVGFAATGGTGQGDTSAASWEWVPAECRDGRDPCWVGGGIVIQPDEAIKAGHFYIAPVSPP